MNEVLIKTLLRTIRQHLKDDADSIDVMEHKLTAMKARHEDVEESLKMLEGELKDRS